MKKLILTVLIVSLTSNVLLLLNTNLKQAITVAKSDEKSDFAFLARRIFIEDPNDIIINFTDLRSQLQKYVGKLSQKTGVYFEYLPTGNSIGVNEKEEFFRASLVKIPVVMRALKLIEENRLKTDDKLTIEKRHIDPTYGELYKRGEGTEISVSDAIRLIVTASDNTAYEVLQEKINDEILGSDIGSEQVVANVYDFLDIPRKELGPHQEITPKNFSSILKSLFFSAYLSYESSNNLLDLMTQSTFTEGLRLGVPDEIAIAHKFGIYNLEPAELQVLSDCGIVYLPKQPYIVCVMVAGNTEVAKTIISDISKIVYEFMSTL